MLGRYTTIWVICAGLFLGYNVFLLASPHRIRVSLVNVVEDSRPDWLDAAPEDLAGRIAFEDPAALASFESPVAMPSPDAWPPSARAVQLLAASAALASRAAGRPRCWNAESPAMIREVVRRGDCRAFCPDYAILFATLAQKAGIPARRVVMEGADGLGGASHVVTELWLADAARWALFDLYNVAYITDDEGRTLSALALRKLLLSGQGAAVTVHQEPGVAQYRGAALLDFYRQFITDLQYSATSRPVTSHRDSRIRRAISEAENFMAPNGPTALMIPRFVGRLMLKQTRYRVRDTFNDTSYHPQRWFIAYRVCLAALLAGLLALVVARLTSRHGAAANVSAWAAPPAT